ncbi:MAG: PAS domain S-box protein, partial [Acidobacteriota bacterium]|nr:PAS domain S-box protein [Acidobacteriota bacterium]
RIKQVIEKKLYDPTPSVHEFDIITKDGCRRTLEVNPKISAIEGEALAIEGVARDITERKQAQEKLRESEERFRRAIAIETVGVIFFKTDGQITDSNDAFLRMSGYDREDCKRGLLRWDKMTPPEFMPQTLKAVDEFLTLGRTVPYEKQYIRKDGSRWWALFAATRINAEEGVEFIIDITERKQMEERLRESEERLRLATEAARMYSWEIDSTTQKVKFSENAVAAFNSDLLPKNFEEVIKIVHPEDREQSLRKFKHALSGTGTFTHQYRVVNSAKKIIWLESYAVTVRDTQGNPVKLIGITQNITERKQIEEIRHTWAERLEAAREDERRRLSHQLHDDIVQQLAVASIKLQRLEKKLVQLLPEENAVFADLVMTQELLRRNQQSLRHMAHVLHSGVLEQFGLKEAFRKFKRNIVTLLNDQSINFSLYLSPNFPRLEPIVENGIYRTVQEAVVNAVKHSHAELISLSLGIKDDMALVVITDDGCGFDAKKTENEGIGFASMYDRAEIIGAKLDVASEAGRGTTITLEVPLEKSRRKV